MRRLAQRVLVVAALCLLPQAARAQTIAGTVRDATGAVLPGVTVEAASPALIEKVRSVVTDDSGQYRIVNLSPGTYTVTFMLTGFATVKREGIELTSDFTAGVSVELRVGAVEETITVSGATPLVDVQSVTKQTVLTRDVLDVLPANHSIQAAGVTIPGVTTTSVAGQSVRDVGGTTKLQQPSINFHGTGGDVQLWDGFHLGNLSGGSVGGGTSFYVNDAGAQELVYSSGADSADMGLPGLYIQMIPKDGGNRFSGVVFADYTHTPWSASNLGDDLIARGLTSVTKVYQISDFNPGFGGPIRRNKLWFYTAYRYEVVDNSVVDDYYDKNPAPYIYEPDFSRPAHDSGEIPNETVRLTWQASQNNKVQFWFTNQNKARHFYGIGSSVTPDGAGRQVTRYAQPITLKWTRTQTNRLLLEAGLGIGRTYFDNGYRETVTSSFDREVIQNTPIYAITDISNNKSFGASIAGYQAFGGTMVIGRFAGSYVTGTHAFKAGMELGRGAGPNGARNWYTGDLTMTFNNGVPQSVTLRIPRDQNDGYSPDLQLYVQDRWTIKRATFSGGVRYDYIVGYVPDSTLPPSRWSPAQFFKGFEVEHWKDLSPRLGVAYDLFGNGKTALKANFSRYVAPESNGTPQLNDPQNTIGRTDTRTWRDLNGDYTIYNADGSVQWDELGPTSNLNFGKVIPSTTTTDPLTLNGFNARGSTVEWQIVGQQQLASRVAMNIGYYYRYLGNQLATDNTHVSAADFDGPFCISAPLNKDLPGGGGYPVCGLYDIKKAKFGDVQNNVTFARNFGGVIDHYQGYDVGATARFGAATFVQGGINGQRRVYDTCNAPILSGTTTIQVDSPEARFCRQVSPYRPDFKLSGSHRLPGDVVVSGTYQLSPGPTIIATWNAPNSVIAPALGRDLAAGATATKSIQLIEPNTIFGKHLSELDVRLSKRLTLGRYRLRGDLNVYNLFNSDFVDSFNSTFSTSASSQFMRPTGVLQGRLFKIGGQIEF